MAFFTRVNVSVPVLPTNENNTEQLTSQHRRHLSEPSTSGHSHHRVYSVRDNSSINTELLSARMDNNISLKSIRGNSIVTINGSSSNTDVSKTIREVDDENIADDGNNDEPKRYEYVVDRVLGVEV